MGTTRTGRATAVMGTTVAAFALLAAGALPAAADTPAPPPGRLAVVDPTGDTTGGSNPAGDLTTLQVSEGTSAAWWPWLSVYTAAYTDPTTDPAWTQDGSTVTWEIDVTRDDVPDLVATFTGGTTPKVEVRLATNGNLVCRLTADHDPVAWGVGTYGTPNQGAGYGVRLDDSCLLGASLIGVRARLDLRGAGGAVQTDVAPDAGFARVGKTHTLSHPVFTSGARWYNSPGVTSDTDNVFGIPSDISVSSSAWPVYPQGPDTPYLATRKVVMRQGTAGGPTFFRQYRAGKVFLGSSPEYVSSFHWGNVGDVPVSGDWDGDGFDTLGLFRPSTGQWFLTDDPAFANQPGQTVRTVTFASPGDVPVAGDWTGTGKETPGVFRNGRWFFLTSLHDGAADLSTLFGNPGDKPVPGYWNSTDVAHVAVWRTGGTWFVAGDNTHPVAVGTLQGGPSNGQYLRPTAVY